MSYTASSGGLDAEFQAPKTGDVIQRRSGVGVDEDRQSLADCRTVHLPSNPAIRIHGGLKILFASSST